MCTEEPIIRAALRTLIKYDVKTLFYDAGKADPELINKASQFKGLKRAHDFSGIGAISNNLTKLWNKDIPDRDVADLLCYFNNLTIDAAKTGFLVSYDDYPEIGKRVNKATGGRQGKMPHFFQYSKNGRRE